METYLVIGVLVGLLILLISNVIRPALSFSLALAVLLFSGLISTQETLGFFANETLISLILLLLVSSVVERTYFIPLLSRKIFDGGPYYRSVLRLSAISMLLSSHLNNTAVVASLMGLVRNNTQFAPSKLLIPLSYTAIMGGVLTLIGTSTNLIVNSFVLDAGLESIQMYDFLYVGLPLALIGTLYLAFVAPRILPDNGIKDAKQENHFFLEAEVAPGSRLIGRSVEANGFRNMEHLYLGEIVRDNTLISPVSPEEVIEAEDALVFAGAISQIQELRQFDGLMIQAPTDAILRSNLEEVVIKHNAPIIGRTIKEVQFRTMFDAIVVAVRRGEEKLSGKMGRIQLQAGDSLVLAVSKEFRRHDNLLRNFIFVNPVPMFKTFDLRESLLILGLFGGGIVLAATGVLSLFKAMVLLLFVFLGLRFLRIKDLKNNLSLDLLLMIGSSLALSHVLSAYGVADQIAGAITAVFGSASPHAALIGVYLTTVIITELVTNNAAAALVFPIALATARQLGVDPMPFIMALAYGASASFLTPVGYQTNTMVFSVGNYRFTDYTRTGIFLSVLYGVVVVWLTPYFFPFS
ncbi:MAG: SLC13 family permease [Bacteroidia bacterium]